jgi:hypothetical protein
MRQGNRPRQIHLREQGSIVASYSFFIFLSIILFTIAWALFDTTQLHQ